jgi:hypothetical protein
VISKGTTKAKLIVFCKVMILCCVGFLEKKSRFFFNVTILCCVGFLEKEVKKDGIPMLDTGDNPDAPAPREMIDLEVISTFRHLLITKLMGEKNKKKINDLRIPMICPSK